ncbi:hypothetical protein [Frigoribacterium sp. 9N]|uniref:hypothetical protein n=1 Tax=Frigoribacterium sp. 9N TaxID=2653144 RepID=UPI0012F3A164|nr:hypothetical protein [Frigoribacterium sp. 9N]VXB07680.1 hypothetical protein FRIGORI9N_180031 [Frigoribacterium sp. 9N]
MTSHDLDDTARDALALELELEELVEAIPGVAHIYQPRATLPALLAARLTPDPSTPPPPPRVEIGDDALLERLGRAGTAVRRVDVRIARVD